MRPWAHFSVTPPKSRSGVQSLTYGAHHERVAYEPTLEADYWSRPVEPSEYERYNRRDERCYWDNLP
ncbi:hypothetical protein GOACH_09_00010 [Gordonia aichiensis NBRC 108223]|uniref:Uncharacterized protein n=1 Tax=Gordonia aichiensis NBRC 108223 TaxID=1220583 RepID=L7KM57_9ACTN|nr:hypothetical protein GOACH_09_00010 [Gordonia aichiensis NBRC 108223]